MKALALWMINLYQSTISQIVPSRCRYRPTCSEYTSDAITQYGIIKGIWMGIKRISRCHPFHEGGYDPVP